MSRPRLHKDYETFSPVDLLSAGEDIYARQAFPLLLALKVDNADTRVYDYSDYFNAGYDDFGAYSGEPLPIPPEWEEAVKDKWYIVAHNASFEMAILRNSTALRHWPRPKLEQWVCTAAKARYWGLPPSLANLGKALNLNTRKDKRGEALIKKFCVPQKAARAKGSTTFIRRIDNQLEEWFDFQYYNKRDVDTEYEADCALPDIPEKFRRIWLLDQAMNIRGFPVDVEGVKRARVFYKHFYAQLEARFREICGGLNPTQVAASRIFLNERYNAGLNDLQAATIRDRLLEGDLSPEAHEALIIRAEAAKASVKKLEAFLDRTGPDGRARGGFLWYGAHTGRWSGRGIQPQNFPRGATWKIVNGEWKPDKQPLQLLPAFFAWLETPQGAPTRADLEAAALIYPSPLAVLSAALRGFIRAKPGRLFVCVDYAQIELRVLAWLAGETELLEQLRQGLDPYIQFAAKYMYNCLPEEVTEFQRQIAKSALLGAQYQIWIWAFIEYCKVVANIKISLEEATNAILSYRSANPNIVDFWGDIERAAIMAVEIEGATKLNCLRFRYETVHERSWLRMYLPNGRPISYYEPKVTLRVTEHERKDKDGNIIIGEDGLPVTFTKKRKVLSFMTEYNGQWIREYTYGGKLTENAVQGIAAEIMGEGMRVANEAGYEPIGTVHDEDLTEIDDPGTDKARQEKLHHLELLVCQLPDCYEGLPIAAEGFYCYRYKKG